ncbi:extracellular solute-binding protein [Streptomyces sp. NBC_00257]|uniref:ABC transporter substrate-binding protein n=1 Tax=unclassified Streptomyces TaxID=2593676 RepID=UPI00225B9561|nr:MULTISPECIES: extracellular solute-binding protein [unclassified Streptomyces]MCX5426464.1 extracellular solute-binding protein [Streptomyces sp. NBC_00062]
MSERASKLSRRGLLGGSILFLAGAAVGCSTDPAGGGSAGAKTALNVWSHAYGEAGTQQALTRYATAFTKATPDIAVKVTWPPGDYSGKLYATPLTDAAPDVFEMGDFGESFARQGRTALLDDIYGSANSFDALTDAAKDLSSKKTKGLFVGQDGQGDSAILPVFSNGGDLVTEDGEAGFGSPQAAEAVAGLKRLHDDRSLLLCFTTGWWDPAALTRNAVPMQWGGLWSMPAIKTAPGDDSGVLPWPAFRPGGKPVVHVGGWSTCANAKGKNVDAAKKFVKWLWIQQTGLRTDWSQSHGLHIPPRTSVAATAERLTQGPAKETVEPAAKPLPPDRVAVVRSDARLARPALLHRQLERLPVAAGHRQGPVRVDGPGRPVDAPHLTDHQPARPVRRSRRDHRPTGGHVPGRPALHRRRHRHQRPQGLSRT